LSPIFSILEIKVVGFIPNNAVACRLRPIRI